MINKEIHIFLYIFLETQLIFSIFTLHQIDKAWEPANEVDRSPPPPDK